MDGEVRSAWGEPPTVADMSRTIALDEAGADRVMRLLRSQPRSAPSEDSARPLPGPASRGFVPEAPPGAVRPAERARLPQWLPGDGSVARGTRAEQEPPREAPPTGTRQGSETGQGRRSCLGSIGASPRSAAGGGRHRSPEPRVLTIPASLRNGPHRVRVTVVVVVLGLALLAGVVFALRVVAAGRAGEAVPVNARPGLVSRSVPTGMTGVSTGLSSGMGSAPNDVSSSGWTASVSASGPSLRVHVVGEIAGPGVVSVPPGSRVIDVITAAGGALKSSDLKRINLARVVVDGEQVHVPAPGEEILAGAYGSTLGVGGAGAVGGSGAGGSASGAGSSNSARVNLNTADLATLDTLPGVGPVLAQRILDWRAAHGRFTSVDELGEVSGIGEKLLAVVATKVTV